MCLFFYVLPCLEEKGKKREYFKSFYVYMFACMVVFVSVVVVVVAKTHVHNVSLNLLHNLNDVQFISNVCVLKNKHNFF